MNLPNKYHIFFEVNNESFRLVMDDLNQENEDEMKDKLESAIQEALDDETYRKVKRMSYQSHNADEVTFTFPSFEIHTIPYGRHQPTDKTRYISQSQAHFSSSEMNASFAF